MLAFVDESGDLGMKLGQGSSSYFAVMAVLFTDIEEASRCQETIRQLRQDLKIRTEFHYCKLQHSHRIKFCEAVSQYQFQIFGCYFNKVAMIERQMSFQRPFTQYPVQYMFAAAEAQLDNATIVIDKTGSSDFRKRLAKELPRLLNNQFGRTVVRKVKSEKSNSNDLLQMADIVCGAWCRSIQNNKTDPHCYRDLLKSKEWFVITIP